METIKKRPMNKQELIQAVEKARLQTRCQARRVIDGLVGVRSDPFAKKDRENRKLHEALPPELDKKFGDRSPDQSPLEATPDRQANRDL